MSNFIYYEKLEDYEEQVKKAKLSDEKAKDEIKRLNNVINQIESIVYADISNIDARITIQEALDKLQELKGSDM